MDRDRIARAMARIEAAVGRIEAAPRPLARIDGDSELARKYETLRGETQAALAELDRVIGSLEA